MESTLDVELYCAHPRHPWQRGTSENRNGLARKCFPKVTDFSKIGPKKVQKVHLILKNMRPHKCLDYRTLYEVHNPVMLQLIWELKDK